MIAIKVRIPRKNLRRIYGVRSCYNTCIIARPDPSCCYRWVYYAEILNEIVEFGYLKIRRALTSPFRICKIKCLRYLIYVPVWQEPLTEEAL